MREIHNQVALVFILILSISLIYLLSAILTPFLLAAILAYLARPLVRQLEHYHIPHLAAVSLIFFIMIFGLFMLALFLLPKLETQIREMILILPKVITWVQEHALAWFDEPVSLSKESLKSLFATHFSQTKWIVLTALRSSQTLIEWLFNLVLTPVVMFYLLRDWDQLWSNIQSLFPSQIKSVMMSLILKIDDVLSAFIRGQLLVMLALCFIYSVGLTLVGLRLGLVIGLLGGILSIVPYLGSVFVLVAALLMGLIEFTNWHSFIWIVVVYAFAHVLEGYVLTPYLIGNKIGLHPVMIIFSVMAGGALFGFFGILLALPVAAVLKVLLGALHHYLVGKRAILS